MSLPSFVKLLEHFEINYFMSPWINIMCCVTCLEIKGNSEVTQHEYRLDGHA